MSINAHTKLCAVIGHPISHSLSPLIHNAVYQATKQNYAYLAFDITNVREAITAMKTLDIKQFAVTVPHKIEVMNYLDIIDPLAKKIGAVNTIINKDGKLLGYNTDIYGVEMTFKINKVDLKNKKVLLIGAGGVSRTIGVVMKNAGAKVIIFDKTFSKAFDLAQSLKCKAESSENMEKHLDYDILINATPVGMTPDVDHMPVDKKIIQPNKIIFDVIYNPPMTKLLKEGKKKGCLCINGADMFVYQAAKQFEILTGKPAPIKTIREVFLKNIK